MSRRPVRRPTLLPAVRRLWRDPHRLQIGTDPGPGGAAGARRSRLRPAARPARRHATPSAALLRAAAPARRRRGRGDERCSPRCGRPGFVVDAHVAATGRARRGHPTGAWHGEAAALALAPVDPGRPAPRPPRCGGAWPPRCSSPARSQLAVPIAATLASRRRRPRRPRRDAASPGWPTPRRPGCCRPTRTGPRGVAAAEAVRRAAPERRPRPAAAGPGDLRRAGRVHGPGRADRARLRHAAGWPTWRSPCGTARSWSARWSARAQPLSELPRPAPARSRPGLAGRRGPAAHRPGPAEPRRRHHRAGRRGLRGRRGADPHRRRSTRPRSAPPCEITRARVGAIRRRWTQHPRCGCRRRVQVSLRRDPPRAAIPSVSIDRVTDIPRGAVGPDRAARGAAAGLRRSRRARARQAGHRHGQRRDLGRGAAAHRRAAVQGARPAQGRRHEDGPGAVRLRGGAARGDRRAVPGGADQAAGGRAADAGRQRAQGARRRSSARAGGSASASSTTRRPPRPASARSTAPSGRTAARSRSRSSTRAPARRCSPTSTSWPGWPACSGSIQPGLDVKPLRRRAARPHHRGARLRAGGGRAEGLRQGVRRRRRDRRAPRGRRRAAGAGHRVGRRHAAVARSSPPAPPSSATWPGCAWPPCTSPPRAGPGCCTPTRTRATSGCSTTAASACSTSARWPGCRAATRNRSAGSPASPWPGRAEEVLAGLRERGLRPRRRSRSTPQAVLDFVRPMLEPITADEFQFTRAWLRGEAARVANPRGPAYQLSRNLNLPPSYMLIHRVTLGSIGVLCQLEARAPYRGVVERWLPGFAEPVPVS